MTTQLRGFLERWNDDRGFGFIFHVDYPKGVFVHISAFKNISRRPVVGDVVLYDLIKEADGKTQAVNARIEGISVSPTKKISSNKANKRYGTKQKSSNSLLTLLVFLGIVVFVVFKSKSPVVPPVSSTPAPIIEQPVITPSEQFTCQGKTYCSEMISCEEAQFYQNHCSGTKMDGDGDGLPCEDWCGH